MKTLLTDKKNLLFIVLLTPLLSIADIKLPSVFGDYMVLQQNANARIWGTADPDESIKVIASWGKELSIKAGANGKWQVAIPTPAGSHTPQQIILKGKNEVYLYNVLIGEVWLCSGQSNMGWSVRQSDNAYEEIKKAILTDLGSKLKQDTIVATNTSSISVTRLAAVTDRPERFTPWFPRAWALAREAAPTAQAAPSGAP